MFSFSPLPRRFCLEIFAGTARVSVELCKLGLDAFPIDICLFFGHDVIDIRVEHQVIIHWLQQGRTSFIWLGMPYTSFSRARKWGGIGPGPLRAYDNVWGYSWLQGNDLSKVQQGNQLLRFSLRLLAICEAHHIPYGLENPYSSYAWHMPPMVQFIQRFSPTFVFLCYCHFGEDWKKPTAILCNFWNGAPLQPCSSTNKCCSRTLRPHVPLSGLADNGLFRTLLAQLYPRAMAAGSCQVASLVAQAI